MNFPRASQCPSCNAPITIREAPATIECQYCGSQFRVFKVDGKETFIRTAVLGVNETIVVAMQKAELPKENMNKESKELGIKNREQDTNKQLYQQHPKQSPTERKQGWLVTLFLIVLIGSCSVYLNNKNSVSVSDSVTDITPITLSETPKPTMIYTPTITNISTGTPTATKTGTKTPYPWGNIDMKKLQSDVINISAGPGSNYISWTQVVYAEMYIRLIGRSEDRSWLLIETRRGDRGWISADLILTENNLEHLPITTDEVPTLTPTLPPTITPTPTKSFAIAPPEGVWCEQNNTRWVCVSNLEYRNNIGYSSVGRDGRFVVMGIVVKNIGFTDISVNPFDFTIVMQDGRTYDHASETYYYNYPLQGVSLAPDNSAEGALVFLVPNDVGPVKIICRGGFFEENIVIDLRSDPED